MFIVDGSWFSKSRGYHHKFNTGAMFNKTVEQSPFRHTILKSFLSVKIDSFQE